MNTELEKIEQMVPAKLFKAKSMGTLLKAIEIEATAEIPDVETDAGRKAITSLAYKVARSKTTIDNLGKDFVAIKKAETAEVDAVRKTAREFLDDLKATVRKPLTDWEDTEARRLEKIKFQLMHIRALSKLENDSPGREGEKFSSDVLKKGLVLLKELKITKRFAEYQDEAINLKNAGVIAIMDAIPIAETREREAEDNERRRLKEEEEKRVANEQRIAREAVDAADLEAKQELERRDREEAQEKADQEAREANTRHKGKVHREVAADFVTMLNGRITEDDAKKLVKALVKKQIRHTTITY